jgi:AmmeMemoRadiSam system protein B
MKRFAALIASILFLCGCASRQTIIENNINNDTSRTGGIVQRAFTMDSGVYDRAFEGNQPTAPVDGIIAGIIPHHLLASHLIARWFEGAKQLNPSVVVVIGPNHNEVGNGPILSSDADWETPYGILNRDAEIIGDLVNSGLLNIDEPVFAQEHSISAEVPFIKRVWPEAKFIPIVLKSRVSMAQQIELAQKLNDILPSDVLVIASADFSHYLTSDQSDQQDAITLPALQSLDPMRVEEMYVDSKPTIRTVLEYSILRHVKTFNLVENSNSAKATGQKDLNEVTSYFTAYYGK